MVVLYRAVEWITYTLASRPRFQSKLMTYLHYQAERRLDNRRACWHAYVELKRCRSAEEIRQDLKLPRDALLILRAGPRSFEQLDEGFTDKRSVIRLTVIPAFTYGFAHSELGGQLKNISEWKIIEGGILDKWQHHLMDDPKVWKYRSVQLPHGVSTYTGWKHEPDCNELNTVTTLPLAKIWV